MMSLKSLQRAVSNGVSMFLSPEGADKPEWRPIVFSNRTIPLIYRISSWGFSGVGALILMFINALRMCDSGFWWRTVGTGLSVQGGLSYMADVYTWGRRDRVSRMWKSLDTLSAGALTCICGPVVCCRMSLGLFGVDADITYYWIICVVFALTSKVMGARAARNKNTSCECVLLWHCGWHALPWFGMLCVVGMVSRISTEVSNTSSGSMETPARIAGL